ncbi:alpha-1,3/1,6-mannosyltransferase ALG2-like [Gigantopelta aegis]|uniref:alpha-1,3/1,6-mannosyltransferase ALG2-like n=1 Tax=Gigantopelta aegis TaxID=1735272 RepID=UPI001B88A76A|nr:alpha-1,3/1,6-mannosyltransferase ALG2-like [Gigantopelta aegis]
MVNVVFLHPDLGIGGAERAVIDAALALQSHGHSVQFVTAHHDATHCFQETKDGTVNVTCAGDWLPRSVLGRCHALCAYLRMMYAALYLVFFSTFQFDLVFCDQISACIPVLRLSNAKVLFYCHFPDMLLTKRNSFLKKLYRAPIDWLEEKTTGMADCVLVNSKFTAGIFHDAFSSLTDMQPKVLYPIPNFTSFNQRVEPPTEKLMPLNKELVFLSINRYERKKNLALALEAFGRLKENFPDLKYIHLIIAGGYDSRVKENVDHYLELKQIAAKLNLGEDATFLKSFTDSEKKTLLKYSSCLLYTPENEHFGIVPIEAMYMKCPVIASNSGGPLETIVDRKTGFLCDPTPAGFSECMEKFIVDRNLRERIGSAGREHVLDRFSFKEFSNTLHNIVTQLVG